jgi:hypothetical protein
MLLKEFEAKNAESDPKKKTTKELKFLDDKQAQNICIIDAFIFLLNQNRGPLII